MVPQESRDYPGMTRMIRSRRGESRTCRVRGGSAVCVLEKESRGALVQNLSSRSSWLVFWILSLMCFMIFFLQFQPP